MTFNVNWENANSQRTYPISSYAFNISDRGKRLRTDVITDLSLFSDTETKEYFIGNVSVSNEVISVTVVDSETNLPVLLAFVPRSRQGEVVKFNRLVDYVDGWIIVDPPKDLNNYIWEASTKEQGLIIPSAVTFSVDGGIQRLLVNGGSAVGDVDFVSTNLSLLKITKVDEYTFNSVTRPAIRIDVNETESGFDVHDSFLSPCDLYPQNLGCAVPPILSLGGVQPDNSGIVYIFFEDLSIPPVSAGSDINIPSSIVASVDEPAATITFDLGVNLFTLSEVPGICDRQQITFSDPFVLSEECYDCTGDFNPCEDDGFGP